MWNNDQQQGTWWPNYNYQYQAASEGKYLFVVDCKRCIYFGYFQQS